MRRTGERENGGTGDRSPVPPFSSSPVLPSSTLVVQTAFLGDVILTLPLIIRLAEQFGPVDVVTTPAAAPIVEHHPAVRQVIRYDKHGSQRYSVTLKSAPHARAYLPHRSFRSALLAFGVPERIGFGGSFPALSYTKSHPWPHLGHVSERILSLLPGSTLPPRPWLHISAEDQQVVTSWMKQQRVRDGFIAMAPGSRWGTKRWPGFPQLAQRYAGQIVVIGDASDRPLGDAILAAVGPPVANACGELTLMQSAALIARSAQLITNDSAPLHLATALDHRVTAIFGPTVPAFGFGPLGPKGSIVEHPNMPCRPCSSHGPMVCPLGHHRCMTEITSLTLHSSPSRPPS